MMIFQPFCIFVFLFLGNFLATFTSFDVFMQVFLFIVFLDGFVFYKTADKVDLSVQLTIVSKCIVIGFFVYWWSTSDMTLQSIPPESTYVAIISFLLEITAQCLNLNKHANAYHHALRFVGLQVCICISFVTITQCLVELSEVLKTKSLLETTLIKTQNCTATEVYTDAIIFNTNTNYENCPSEIWMLIRINFIFATQAYILYTLTTAIYTDFKMNPSSPFVIGLAALVECVTALAAVVGQFDIIYNCYNITTSTCVLLNIALVSYLVRKHEQFIKLTGDIGKPHSLSQIAFNVLNGNIRGNNSIEKRAQGYILYQQLPQKLKL